MNPQHPLKNATLPLTDREYKYVSNPYSDVAQVQKILKNAQNRGTKL